MRILQMESSMSRPWISRNLVRSPALLAVLTAASCSSQEHYALGQAINMGPWSFEVERVRETVESNAYRRQKIVDLTLRLHNYTERHETNFDDFLNGSRSGALMSVSFPKLELEHSDGATFLGSVSPSSGGSLRSERWRARVWLIPDNAGLLADAGNLARRYADTPLSEFTLVIENPNRLSGQPRRVRVAL